jgi:hypothetical protein
LLVVRGWNPLPSHSLWISKRVFLWRYHLNYLRCVLVLLIGCLLSPACLSFSFPCLRVSLHVYGVRHVLLRLWSLSFWS